MRKSKPTIQLVLVVTFFAANLQAEQHLIKAQPDLELKLNLPPGETHEPPPEPIDESPPVYLDVDSEGNVYRLEAKLDKSGNYNLSHILVSRDQLGEIASKETIVLQNMENIKLSRDVLDEGQSTENGSSCPLPSSFSIIGDSTGAAWGFAKVANTNRPPGVTAQWIVFDFYTRVYRLAAAHMPVALFHEDTMHGWGAFLGNNSGDLVYGCGAASRFNSQIEGWIQYGVPPQPISPTWQNAVLPESCGNEMYDGPVMVVPGVIHVPRYRMEMQTSTGHWVSYRILEYKLSPDRWETLTDWTTYDVDDGVWDEPTHTFNNSAEGIFIFSTDGDPVPWEIRISNTQCGWF